jgi:SAM-dependent methyltransferase
MSDTSNVVASGTKQDADALKGKGFLQSDEEWDARNLELTTSISKLLSQHARLTSRRALDVGCMQGELTDRYGAGLALDWYGIDPDIEKENRSKGGAFLNKGFAHNLDFPDKYFDCIVFANVYEHIPPNLREMTLSNLYRVLAPGGILVGQIPNPYFPIESHSRLPFLGYLPRTAQRWYWRLTPTGWDFEKAHFFSVTKVNLRRIAEMQGFHPVLIRNFNYSLKAIPSSVRWAAALHARLGYLPWAWQFVFRKPESE